MSVAISILVMLLILSVLTIVHEWGHFIAARIFKVKVTEFSIFMGPKLYQRKSKKTGMLFSIRLLPLGGYCAFEDDEIAAKELNNDKNEADSEADTDAVISENTENPADCEEKTKEMPADCLAAQVWWKRLIIFSAGVFMNIVLALVLCMALVCYQGYTNTTLTSVDEDTTAAFVGIEAGDSIYKIQNIRTRNYLDDAVASYNISDSNPDDNVMDSHYTSVYKKADGTKINLDIKKNIKYEIYTDENGEEAITYDSYTYTVEKTEDGTTDLYIFYCVVEEIQDNKALCIITKTLNGEEISCEEKYLTAENFCVFGNDNVETVKTWNPIKLVAYGYEEMVSMVKSIYISFYWLLSGQVGFDAVSGPVGLTSVVNEVVGADLSSAYSRWSAFWLKFFTFVNLAAVISANLGVVNFFPIPGLDGCHALLVIIEAITKKKLSLKTQTIISYIGLALMIALALVVMFFDIFKLIS